MKKAFIGMAARAAAVVVALAAVLSAPGVALADGGTTMWRLYNPNSGEHFYTAGVGERNNLVSVGWIFEGVGWIAPESGQDVYRLYNPNGGDHHYTTSAGERDVLVSVGWQSEGVGWKSGGSAPVYRQYNKNASSGAHNFTASKAENDALVSVGWQSEGIAWQATGTSADYDPSPINAEAHATYQAIIAASPYVEWYGFFDLDGDRVDEMIVDEYDYKGGSGRDMTLYGYWDRSLRTLCSYTGYGHNEFYVYPQTLSFIEYHTGHGGESYECMRYANGTYSNVAYKSHYSTKGGALEDGPWSYSVGGNDCSQQEYDAFVAGLTQGPCTTYNIGKWATRVRN
ncbi:MAG: hypothetical protein Q4B54_06985 [Coriobacteriales bacterium]|nr:hypothetical protein [Coriobacteriales bacterium]